MMIHQMDFFQKVILKIMLIFSKDAVLQKRVDIKDNLNYSHAVLVIRENALIRLNAPHFHFYT